MRVNIQNTALQFNSYINNRDIEGLAGLMTDDHVFIDNANNCIFGKENNIENWRNFFKLFPLYRNIFEKVSSKGNTVLMEGYSVCSDEILNNVKAIWTAKIEGDKVKEWRVCHVLK